MRLGLLPITLQYHMDFYLFFSSLFGIVRCRLQLLAFHHVVCSITILLKDPLLIINHSAAATFPHHCPRRPRHLPLNKLPNLLEVFTPIISHLHRIY